MSNRTDLKLRSKWQGWVAQSAESAFLTTDFKRRWRNALAEISANVLARLGASSFDIWEFYKGELREFRSLKVYWIYNFIMTSTHYSAQKLNISTHIVKHNRHLLQFAVDYCGSATILQQQSTTNQRSVTWALNCKEELHCVSKSSHL